MKRWFVNQKENVAKRRALEKYEMRNDSIKAPLGTKPAGGGQEPR